MSRRLLCSGRFLRRAPLSAEAELPLLGSAPRSKLAYQDQPPPPHITLIASTTLWSYPNLMPDLARFRAKHDAPDAAESPSVSFILHVDMDAFFVSVELLE